MGRKAWIEAWIALYDDATAASALWASKLAFFFLEEVREINRDFYIANKQNHIDGQVDFHAICHNFNRWQVDEELYDIFNSRYVSSALTTNAVTGTTTPSFKKKESSKDNNDKPATFSERCSCDSK